MPQGETTNRRSDRPLGKTEWSAGGPMILRAGLSQFPGLCQGEFPALAGLVSQHGNAGCSGPLYKHGPVSDHNAMPYSDFDLHGLARYLHLAPQQVAKLADRGQLPGRKVGGEWRFSKADIHHWLERRIGLSDEEELLEVEGVLSRSAPVQQEEEISIADLLPLEAIAVPLPARTRSSVIDSMVELAAQTGWLWDPQAMAEAIRSREEMHSTALANGVALLHPRRPLPKILAQAFVALGVTSTGIPFGADVPMTDIFFLIARRKIAATFARWPA